MGKLSGLLSPSAMETRPSQSVDAIAASILDSYRQHGKLSHVSGEALPNREVIWSIVEELLRLIFPGFLEPSDPAPTGLEERTLQRVRRLSEQLRGELIKGLTVHQGPACTPDRHAEKAEEATCELLSSIPQIREALAQDIEAAYDGDPAAQYHEEIILAYPGLQAVAVYRLAHVLHSAGVPLVPRVMSEYAHSRTGIDIHPGAKIGKRFFIDHGTGVVIGETCILGDNVKIYQGVTLGARSFTHDERGRVIKGTKRHPDIADRVTIYSGATILGPIHIGEGSVVGGNVWLTTSVPPDTRIVVRTAQQVHIDREIDDYQI